MYPVVTVAWRRYRTEIQSVRYPPFVRMMENTYHVKTLESGAPVASNMSTHEVANTQSAKSFPDEQHPTCDTSIVSNDDGIEVAHTPTSQVRRMMNSSA